MSRTKVAISAGQIETLVRDLFGAQARVMAARTAEDGMYNIGYHLELGGGAPARVFLKVAPPDEVDRLTHERDLMRAEVSTMGAVRAARVGCAPALLHADFTRRLIDRDYIFTEHLEGAPLSRIAAALSPEEAADVRRQIGRIAGRLPNVTAPVFGYPHLPALQGPTWAAAFARMTAALLADAQRLSVTLTPDAAEISALFRGAGHLLGGVDRAELAHFDLWDGNILVRREASGVRVTGVIDWERAFYGDPLAELICLAGFKPPQAQSPVMRGLAETRARPLAIDEAALRRLAVYRAYLWLIMIIESKPRGARDETWPARERALIARLHGDFASFA
jgi:aminoglycoside phosphotransferase (APT) family kinase protein